jgi:soluble lytic murein transglycosylase
VTYRMTFGRMTFGRMTFGRMTFGTTSMIARLRLLSATLLASATYMPTLATAAPETTRAPAAVTALPAAFSRQLDAAQRDQARAAFAAIRAGQWSDAAARIDAMGDALLAPIARAELFLAKGSPKVDTDRLVTLIERAPELPQADALARLARSRGAEELPVLPIERDLIRLPGAPKRQSARAIRSDAVAAALGPQIIRLIKDDRPSDAEALLTSQSADLSPEARTEWTQRVAWSYFLSGDDSAARRMAEGARTGIGDWSVQADWVAGLAAWRQRDYAAAIDAFSAVASRAGDAEMRAAGLFWSARASTAAGRPDLVQTKLRNAARLAETFYGLLAKGALGMAQPSAERGMDFASADWTTLSTRPNARVAAALVEAGETALADQLLRHQARIGADADHAALLHLANRLELPSTQIWLAQHGPRGAGVSASARYPAPSWTPQGGWRVDRALIFAHALQESQFRVDAVSRAGASGLMQLMPGTAQLVARRRGESIDRVRLVEPAVNIEYGQSYLEQLRDMPGTGGLLPKVIAAYNAGPGSVEAWNARGRDRGDPLLFIESIPFVETRAYVAIVLRNYWMYQRQAGQTAVSLKAIAQGMWPRFPGLAGQTAVRLDSVAGIASAD